MSASTDHHTKREIRRAFGPVAIDLISQQAKAIVKLEERLNLFQQAYAARERVSAQAAAAVGRQVASLEHRCDELETPFWPRVARWLRERLNHLRKH